VPDVDAQLVQQIADAVIARLGRGTSVHTRATTGPREIHPPIGVCTGDYSKFPELRTMASAGGPKPALSEAKSGMPENTEQKPVLSEAKGGIDTPTIAPLTGFITARQVDEAIGPILHLAFGAKLTPLAKDRLKERGLTVQRCTPNKTTAANPANTAAGAWAWWMEGNCPAARQLTTDRKHLHACPARQLPEAVQRLARAVKAGSRDGGIFFVPAAARVTCYANRCPSLRAVVGTCGQAVEEGIAHLGANVLIIEYPHHGPASMQAMIDRFTQARREPPANVATELKELASCESRG